PGGITQGRELRWDRFDLRFFIWLSGGLGGLTARLKIHVNDPPAVVPVDGVNNSERWRGRRESRCPSVDRTAKKLAGGQAFPLTPEPSKQRLWRK
ncbi:MAG TPA: hypothetical protein VEY93_07145, partial [Longimicrobium sp.]|nr:hypothetical protein [Longimicrobium sp.]